MRVRTLLIIAALSALPVAGQQDKDEEAKGAASLFHNQCAGCHGADGKGQTFIGKRVHAADLTSEAVQQQTDAALSEVIHSGKGKMPAFGAKLSDQDIQNLLAYVRQFRAK